jgi:hypothetical protein
VIFEGESVNDLDSEEQNGADGLQVGANGVFVARSSRPERPTRVAERLSGITGTRDPIVPNGRALGPVHP